MDTLAAHAQAAVSGSNDKTGTFAVKVYSRYPVFPGTSAPIVQLSMSLSRNRIFA